MPKENPALNRLVKKLNALRKTLRKEEREMLDQMIIGPEPEVAGHRVAVSSRASGAAMGATLAAKRQEAAEVEGHALYDNSKLAKREPQAANARREQEPEVEGHRMSITPAANAPQRAASAKREEEPEVEGHRLTITHAANAPQQAASAKRQEQPEVEGHQLLVPMGKAAKKTVVTITFDSKKREYVIVPQ